jgi:hypothetical protein
MLAAGQEHERERLRQTQLPRSTYHAVRRRAYAEGWLRDRYLPNPLLFGFPRVTFALARPFADRTDEGVRRWSEDPGCVLLWRSPQTLFGVFFHPSDAAADRAAARLFDPALAPSSYHLSADLRTEPVPVYFDFEGLWSHLAEIPGAAFYPRALGGPLPAPYGRRLGSATELTRRTAQDLLARPFAGDATGRPGHLMGPVALPRSQRRLVEQGWVDRRVFPDPGRIPPYRGRNADQMVFVQGEVLPEGSPSALLTTLIGECRVFPFLFATHAGRVLVGALGQSGAPTDPPVASVPFRRPVLATLQQFLRGIEIVQEPAANFQPLIDHRYDRLIPGTA